MPLQNNKNKILHLAANTTGTDYVVGDLHGCLEDLLRMLKAIGFNELTDRLFSVGDLIDRGPHSKECAELVFKPWFFAVRGNHEQMMIDSYVNGVRDGLWEMNGGMWHHEFDQNDMRELARQLDYLPYVIVVGEGVDRFNVVHGELVKYDYVSGKHTLVTDAIISCGEFSGSQFDNMLWGRSIISNGRESITDVRAEELRHDLADMSITFVGHTPVRETVQCQQQMYLDNGAVYHHTNKLKSEQNALVIACPSTKLVYAWNMLWKRLSAKPFDNIPKMG